MHVPSPGFAPSSEIATTFLSSPPVARALEKARSADVVLVSVGIVGCDSLLVAEGFMTEEAMTEVTDAGAVGEVFGWYFDADGHSVQAPSLHPVALTLDELRNASRVIGVAGGTEKADAIKGAIAAGILDELAIRIESDRRRRRNRESRCDQRRHRRRHPRRASDRRDPGRRAVEEVDTCGAGIRNP